VKHVDDPAPLLIAVWSKGGPASAVIHFADAGPTGPQRNPAVALFQWWNTSGAMPRKAPPLRYANGRAPPPTNPRLLPAPNLLSPAVRCFALIAGRRAGSGTPRLFRARSLPFPGMSESNRQQTGISGPPARNCAIPHVTPAVCPSRATQLDRPGLLSVLSVPRASSGQAPLAGSRERVFSFVLLPQPSAGQRFAGKCQRR